ncbi:MAG: hypothetical protein LUH15_10005 [Tannerellaceae bacterium]|nr:hypothetical protein [Tannerellaceae bacterium]
MGDADIQIMKGWSAHVGIAYNRKTSDAVNHKKQVKMITSKFVPTDGQTKDNQIEKINTIRSYYSFNAYTQYEKHF